MTDSEAEEILNAKLNCMQLYDLSWIEKGCDRDCDDCDLNYAKGNSGEQKEALFIAIKALEKQIAKKPIDNRMFSECPICENVNIQGCEFCPNCGQKLKWEENNEKEKLKTKRTRDILQEI